MCRSVGRRSLGWLTAAVLLSGIGCGAPPAETTAPPPPAVSVSRPVMRSITDEETFTGRTEAVATAEVRARVGGYLQQVYFTEGAEVRQGDLLAVIDPRPFAADLEKARADIGRAEAALKLALAEVQRSSFLRTKTAASQADYDKTVAEVGVSAAAVKAAEATAERARLDWSFTRITAPISGVIGRRLVTDGNVISGGSGTSTLLATIVTVDPMYAYFDVDENA